MALTLSNYLMALPQQYMRGNTKSLWRNNIFRSMYEQGAWDFSAGLTPKVRSFTGTLPDEYPTLTNIALSSSNDPRPSQLATAQTILRGERERTYQLGHIRFDTSVFSVADLKRGWLPAEALTDFGKHLRQFSLVTWADLYRLWNIKYYDTKVSTRGSDVILTDSTVDAADFASLASLPNADLGWGHLKQLYDMLLVSGYVDELAIGTSNGAPVFPLVARRPIIEALFRDADSREEIKYFDPQSNLAAFSKYSVNGFAPFIDMHAIRFGDSDGIASTAELVLAKMIYPTVNVAAAGSATDDIVLGSGYKANPYYKTIANGGYAEYEVVTVPTKNAFKVLVEPPDPASIGEATFNPSDYSGEVNWINNKTFQGTNDHGDVGYFELLIGAAAKPINPEWGFSIVTKAKD